MDYAKKILGKYGWKEGDGLGKNNNGIAKPLKATLKFDNAGLGADQAADFNNHWWERVFNDAARNVDVENGKDGIVMRLKDESEDVEISTKSYSVKKLEKAKKRGHKTNNTYDNFLQAATLTKEGDEVEKANKISVEDIQMPTIKVLTDEELFQACGGRTAHKGARHGLKLNGKLSRIEKQEQELLAKMIAKVETDRHKSQIDTDLGRSKRKQPAESISDAQIEETTNFQICKKKKKKPNGRISGNEREDQERNGADGNDTPEKRNKDQKDKKPCASEEPSIAEDNESPNKTAKKKKHRRKEFVDNEQESEKIKKKINKN